MIHVIKTWSEFFQALEAGTKNFEIRFNDRGYQAGDELLIREFIPNPKGGRYSGREVRRTVTYITNHEQRRGFVVMGLVPAA